MARLRREQRVIPNQPNHVVLRGNNRRNLFSYANDRDFFIRLLRRFADDSCLFHNIALLTNHVHLVATPDSVEALSGCIKNCSQQYATYRNKRRGGSGKLFEERFFSKPIADDFHMAVVSAYVDLNPTDAHMPLTQRRWTT